MGFLNRIFGRKDDSTKQQRRQADYGFQAAGEGYEFGLDQTTWEEMMANHPEARGNAFTGQSGPIQPGSVARTAHDNDADEQAQ